MMLTKVVTAAQMRPIRVILDQVNGLDGKSSSRQQRRKWEERYNPILEACGIYLGAGGRCIEYWAVKVWVDA